MARHGVLPAPCVASQRWLLSRQAVPRLRTALLAAMLAWWRACLLGAAPLYISTRLSTPSRPRLRADTDSESPGRGPHPAGLGCQQKSRQNKPFPSTTMLFSRLRVPRQSNRLVMQLPSPKRPQATCLAAAHAFLSRWCIPRWSMVSSSPDSLGLALASPSSMVASRTFSWPTAHRYPSRLLACSLRAEHKLKPPSRRAPRSWRARRTQRLKRCRGGKYFQRRRSVGKLSAGCSLATMRIPSFTIRGMRPERTRSRGLGRAQATCQLALKMGAISSSMLATMTQRWEGWCSTHRPLNPPRLLWR
mmetsp:Transcript_7637/g.23840  ORF Transcript_7637/g.23840 Transcript_7637/m.23840 type:complete len:304 (-) Transcript_7637:545-1456(-)